MKRLAALGFTALAATTWGACESTNVAAAQAVGNCGGNSQVHMAPIDCTNTLTLQGVKGSVRLVVDDNGFVLVTAVVQDLTPNTPLPPLYLQVKAHRGISSNAGFEGRTDVFDGNTASVEFQMPLDPAFNCTSQIDTKIVPGQPTLDHVAPIFRVAAPLVGVAPEVCQPPAPTVPDTAPTSAPVTTVPATSPPGSGGSTTVTPTVPSSVTGRTIPATGFPTGLAVIGAGLLILVGGLGLMVRRSA
jgi:hypothetical protein